MRGRRCKPAGDSDDEGAPTQAGAVVTIPVWMAGTVLAALLSLAAAGIAWAVRMAGDMREVRLQLSALVERGKQHDVAVMHSEIEALKAESANLRAGHERNRQRIEQAYRDLAGNGARPEPTRPG